MKQNSFPGPAPSVSPVGALCVLLGIMLMMVIASSLAGALLINILPSERNALLCASVIQNVLAFAFPAWAIARIISSSSSNAFSFLGIRAVPSTRNVIGAIILFIIALPALEQIITWNEALKLPPSLSALEAILREWENASAAITQKLLSDYSVWGLFSGVVCVGIITGVSEELFFRGAMQSLLARTRLGSHGAIWMAAFIFSVLHFQFFGFVPRFILGLGFGYLFFWTRSIWVSATIHALNNSLVVVAAWLEGKGIISSPDFGSSLSEFPLIPLIMAVLTAAFLAKGRNYFFTPSNS